MYKSATQEKFNSGNIAGYITIQWLKIQKNLIPIMVGNKI